MKTKHSREENVKIIVHVQLIRVISIYYSYFLHIIFWENPMYKSPGEYCLNVSKQLEYKSSDAFFLNIFYFKLNVFLLFYMILIYYVLCWIDACDVTFVTVIFILSRSYAILVGAASWIEPNDLTVLAYQEEIIMLNCDYKP